MARLDAERADLALAPVAVVTPARWIRALRPLLRHGHAQRYRKRRSARVAASSDPSVGRLLSGDLSENETEKLIISLVGKGVELAGTKIPYVGGLLGPAHDFLTGRDDSEQAKILKQVNARFDALGFQLVDGNMNVVYVPVMTLARTVLGVTRALIGIGSWIAPDQSMRLFGIDPEQADRFVGRLFGSRELALAGALLAAPASALAPVAALGAAVDAVDAVAGFDERRRGNLSTQATILGPVGVLLFVALGVHVAREASATAA